MHVIDYGRAKVTSVYGHGETVYKMLKIMQKYPRFFENVGILYGMLLFYRNYLEKCLVFELNLSNYGYFRLKSGV